MSAKLPAGYFDCAESELETYSVPVLRAIYRAHIDRAGYFMPKEAVVAHAKALNPRTPAQWIVAVRSVRCGCERCSGTGVYNWGGTVNGVPVHSGDCFRCGAKGWLNFDDMRRCNIYDRYAISRACAM